MEEPPSGDLLDPEPIVQTRNINLINFICCDSKQDYLRLIFN